jgi:hypothetical protein
MRREHRPPTAKEWRAIASPELVVRCIPPPEKKLPKCVAYSKPIPRSEPDVVLKTRAGSREKGYFHSRCAGAGVLGARGEDFREEVLGGEGSRS